MARGNQSRASSLAAAETAAHPRNFLKRLNEMRAAAIDRIAELKKTGREMDKQIARENLEVAEALLDKYDALADAIKGGGRGLSAAEGQAGGIPPLGAPPVRYDSTNDIGARDGVVGARAHLADGKSTPEIKKMIVADLKSPEAKAMGILGINSARTSGRKVMEFDIKLNTEVPSGLANSPEKLKAAFQIAFGRGRAEHYNSGVTDAEVEWAKGVDKTAGKVKLIANAYDKDFSDIQTDYFDYRYSTRISLTDKNGVRIWG